MNPRRSGAYAVALAIGPRIPTKPHSGRLMSRANPMPNEDALDSQAYGFRNGDMGGKGLEPLTFSV